MMENAAYRVSPSTSPTHAGRVDFVAFINPKSGGRRGLKAIEYLRANLRNCLVFDLVCRVKTSQLPEHLSDCVSS